MKLHGWLWAMGYYSEHCPINESRQHLPNFAQLIPRESDQRLVGPGFVSEARVWYMMFWMAIRWSMLTAIMNGLYV